MIFNLQTNTDIFTFSANRVEKVPPAGLGSLEWLSLDKNQLTTLSHLSFLPLANLNGLDIHQNPWNCTCQLKPFMKVGEVTGISVRWKFELSHFWEKFSSNIHGSWTYFDISLKLIG